MEQALTVRHDPILAYREGHPPSELERLSEHPVIFLPVMALSMFIFSRFGRTNLGKVGFFTLGGVVGGGFLGFLAQKRFEKWVDQRREETEDHRKAFCRAILENDIDRRPESARKGFFECISSFFSNLFSNQPKETMEKNECGEPLTKRSYVLSVGGRDKIVSQRILHIMVESLMRCPTEIERTSLPLFLSHCAGKLQELQRDFQKIPQEKQQKFSLLENEQDESSQTAAIISQASWEHHLWYQVRPPLALWNRAKRLVIHLCEMQGERAETMWNAFNYAANDIRKAHYPNPPRPLRH